MAVVALACALGFAACGGGAGVPGRVVGGSTPLGTRAETASAETTSATPPLAAATAATPAMTPAGLATAGPLIVDPGLLRFLPASVDGVPMQSAPEAAAGMIADASLARSASALAVGLVVAPGASTGDDFAASTVVQLRPGIFDDDFYGRWRDAYDQAACAQAGGVASDSRVPIGPNTVEETLCAGGARTYHTHLAGDILVSITAVGDRGYGNLVMAGLRE